MTAATIIASYSGGGTLWDPGVEVQDGDAVLWFYREATDVGGPGTRMCDLADSGGTTIGASLYTKGNWGIYSTEDYYITSLGGEFQYDSEGNAVVDDTVYAVFDQFTSFTAGEHYIKFDLPGVSRARVEAAHLLRGVAPETPGTYHYYAAEDPTWDVYYDSGGSLVGSNFPVSVSLGTGGTLIYCLWSQYGSGGQPSGYNSAPGTALLSYNYYDAADPPAVIQTLATYFDELEGVSKSVTAPDENGASGAGSGTGYAMDAIVINGGEAVAPKGPTVYFADLIVFNAKSGATVEF